MSVRLDSAARKAIKDVAPAPVGAGLSPAQIDPDILSLLDEGARGPAKAVDKALVSLHDALAAVMGLLGQSWQQLDSGWLRWWYACWVWKTVYRRRLLWLAHFLGDFKQVALVLEDLEDLPVIGCKLFGEKFLKGLYKKALSTKQARMIKEVLGAKEEAAQGLLSGQAALSRGPLHRMWVRPNHLEGRFPTPSRPQVGLCLSHRPGSSAVNCLFKRPWPRTWGCCQDIRANQVCQCISQRWL